MTEAFIYDAIRTPRGKGKKDGSLHEVKPVNLLAGVLTELQRRNDFDTAQVDDVVMGCVSPVGEQGAVHRQDRGAQGRLGLSRRGRAAQPLLRLGPGSGEPGGAEGALAAGKTWWWPAAWRACPRADGLRRRRLGAGPGDQHAPPRSCRRASAPT